MLRIHTILPLLCIIFAMTGCSDRPDTPEQRVRDYIAEGETAVEAREIMDVMLLISEEYKDTDGRSKKDLLRLLTVYILRHKSIHLLIQINQITFPGPQTSQVSLYAAMAGRPIKENTQLLSLSADLHRFDLKLKEEEGTWRLISGEWRRARQSDLL